MPPIRPLLRLATAIGLLLIAGCAATSAGRAATDDGPAVARSSPAPLQTPEEQAQYHVMVGEMAVGRRQPKLAAEEFLKALKRVPDAKLAARATGLALAADDPALALDAAEQWLRADPASLEAREIIIRLALQRGDSDTAFTQCRAIIDGHPGGKDDGFRLVALLLGRDADRGDAALTLMRRLVDVYPKLAGAYRAEALLALRFHRLPLAQAAARQALALAPKSEQAVLLLLAAQVQQDELNDADATLQRALGGGADSTSLRLGYARLLMEAHHPERARRQLQTLLARQPHNGDARFLLGLLELSQNRLDAAAAQFGRLTHGSHAEDAEYYLGRIEEQRGKLNSALAHYRRVTSGDRALDASLHRALVLGRMGRLDEARQILEQLAEQYPPLAARFADAESEMLIQAGHPRQAVSVLDKALQRNPDDPALLYSHALALEKLGEVAAAEGDLRRILQRSPNDAQALNALGYMITVHGGDYAQARELIEKANRLAPDDPAIMDSLGWVLYRQGHARQALPWLTQAYGKARDPEIAAHLSQVLWSLGEKSRARAILDEALKRTPDDKHLRETAERLQR